jgi:hypothetical protein
MNPYERVEKLIALATNAGASESEARNAALSAVKLIAEHKMLSVTPPPGVGPQANAFASMFVGLGLETLIGHVGTIAAGAGAMEILELRNKNGVLERQNERMKAEIARLNGELVGKAAAPIDFGKARRRRRRR